MKARLRRQVGHGGLQRTETLRHGLTRGEHAHIDILLGSLDLLLLLLEKFDLLLDSKLIEIARSIHAHQRSQLRRAPAMSDMEATAGWARDASGLRLLLLLH